MADRDEPEVMRPVCDVYGWVEQESSIMLKAATKHGDPVELTSKDARAVAKAMLELANRLDGA